MKKAFIKNIEYYLPSTVVTNDHLADLFPDWDAQKIYNKLGIKNRYVVSENETASDLAIKAAEKLFTKNSIPRESIDYIIYCTQSPDYFLPTTACIIQEKLGLSIHSGAIDINQGCSGYVYGLGLAKGLLSGGIASNILFITAETYSKYLDPSDKSNRSIFGDAATATLITTDGVFEIGDFYFGTNGKGFSNLIVENGAAKNPIDTKNTNDNKKYLFMDGPEIFNFTLDAIPIIIENTCKNNNTVQDDIDYFIFHQANKYLLDNLRKKMKIDQAKYYNDLAETGNTVSCTIPIALYNTIQENKIEANSKVLLAGFGVGYSWGGCIIHKQN